MEEAILSDDTAEQVCAGDLLIVLLLKLTMCGSQLFPILERGNFPLKFSV